MIVRNSIVELKETKLWNYLNEIDKIYADYSIVFVEQITPLLKSIQDFFPYYTRHDAHHGYRVLRRMDQILSKECLKKDNKLSLTNIEAFLLICSSYAHDLGMTVFPNEKDILINQLEINDEHWKSNVTLQKHLRKYHSQRGGSYIDQNYEKLNIPKNLISPLDLLMTAHNLSINELEVKLGKRVAGGEKELDLKQLACILCIADSLEFSETRIVDGVLDTLKDKIKNHEESEAITSYKENLKHVCIGDSVAIGKDGKIIISGTFDDPEVLNLAHKTIDFIESWVRDYIDIDLKSSLRRLIVRGDSIERNLVILGSDFERLGIRIKKDHIINLISSNSTWSNDTGIVIKELLQNSVEACRYRKFNSIAAADYKPHIDIKYNKSQHAIIISDNGCGMSRSTILNNFLTVGNSRSMDPTYKTSSYSSLARFGIGFWSTFTIANSVSIQTAPFEYMNVQLNSEKIDGLTFEVSINEFKDYTLFKKTSLSPGTTITLLLKKEIGVDDLLMRLNNSIVCSEIPINISNGEEEYSIPTNISLPSLADLTGAKRKLALEHNVKEFIFEKQYDSLTFKLKLLYTMSNGAATFKLSNNISVMHMLNRYGYSEVFSICGFKTAIRLYSLIFDFGRIGLFVANTNNPEGFVFNLNRHSLISSDAYTNLINILTEAVNEAYRYFLKTTNSTDKKTVYILNQQSRSNGGNTYGNYSKFRLWQLYNKVPDLLIFKLTKISKGLNLLDADIRYESFDELRNYRFQLWSCTVHIFNAQIRLNPEENTNFIYAVIEQITMEQESYFLEPNLEIDLLFDNDPYSFVHIISVETVTKIPIKLPLLRINSHSLQPFVNHKWFICEIRGVWTGTILEKEILGANFVFIGQHKLIVKPNTNISIEIKNLHSKGQIMKLCDLVKLLNDASDGFTDDSVLKFM
ncbi:ATP-binding protein [Mucilaginibacter sp. KACC 22773]|uniref:HD domain-containing protein n=1 Tax=Mucilaginibacter sp. KACC 22773 TaxID=3025671 RepID=UPI002365BD39|nr:ATP-binding protein [Mucilaginibacter sp. KACC 22773]WDF76480.1 ATP-binding protein [Mucilaginibacter sp. KACC 22773]